MEEKLLGLDGDKHADLLKVVLAQKGKELLTLSSETLTGLIPSCTSLQEAYFPYEKGLFTSLKQFKWLAHAFALAEGTITLHQKSFPLEGATPGSLNPLLVEAFLGYLRQDSLQDTFPAEQISAMEKSIQPILHMIDAAELAQRVELGEVVALSTGFTAHAIGVVFFRNRHTGQTHLIVSNRGSGTDYFGLSELIWSRTGSLKECFETLNKRENRKYNLDEKKMDIVAGIDDFWQKLTFVGGIRGHAIPLMEQYPQPAGTCQHDNLLGALFGVLYAHAMQRGCSHSESIPIMVSHSKPLAAFKRNAALSSAVQFFKSYPADLEVNLPFLQQLYNKALVDTNIDRSLVKQWKQTLQNLAMHELQ